MSGISVPKPQPDQAKAAIEEAFADLVDAAARLGVIPQPAVYQDIDEWLGAELAGRFKQVCRDIFLKLTPVS